MEKTHKSESYLYFKKDIQQILHLKDEFPIINEISLLAWEVSFLPKKERIEKILSFLKAINPDKILEELHQYNIFEFILSLSHFRRAKYHHESSSQI